MQILGNRHILLHSYTLFVLGLQMLECNIGRKIKHFHEEPGWRNRQTQRTQNPPGFGPWGFDSPSRHQHLSLYRAMVYGASWSRGADDGKWPQNPQRDANVM